MDESFFKKVMTTIIIVALVVLSFLILRPILMSIVVGIVFVFILAPVYNWVNKKIKVPNISAIIISVFLILLIILPIWFLTPLVVDQSLKLYFTTRQIDFVTPLENFFPSLFASKEFSNEVGSIIYSFVNKTINSITNYASNLILNFPALMLQLTVAFFTFFFVLRDKEEILNYIKSLLPFSKNVKDRMFKQTRGITMSVLYGQIIVGILQGIIVGIGFFIFGVSNALLLTLFAALAGIFPVVGTALVWIPLAIFLFVEGNIISAIGVSVFGLIASTVDNIIRPMIVARRTTLPTSITLIGMIGGFFLFGVLGFILGPLILAYLLIILDIYRNKRTPGLLKKEPSAPKLKLNL
ncbi:AI-2E family transporter [Candidatus Pacearchaeota archaeon]|nr:AI-2E family transporter [Candidatus Pacearchaeota archaeon]